MRTQMTPASDSVALTPVSHVVLAVVLASSLFVLSVSVTHSVTHSHTLSLTLLLTLSLSVRVQERHIKEAIQRADVIATVSIPIPRVVEVPDYEESFGPNAKAFARPSGYIVHIGAHTLTPWLTRALSLSLSQAHTYSFPQRSSLRTMMCPLFTTSTTRTSPSSFVSTQARRAPAR